MNQAIVYALLSTLVVSLISVVAALPFLLKKKLSQKVLLTLLSLSVGALLATVFVHFLPEAVSHGYTLGVALWLLAGFLLFFVLEKFVHYHHNKCHGHEHPAGHSHGYHLAPINLIGDGIHNFIDGIVIAGAYMVNVGVGIAATVSVLFHEVPQEVADMGVLLYAGMSKKKAVLYNLLSALTAVVGAVVGIILAGAIHNFSAIILPFASGVFLYIAASNLLPELHKHCGLKDTLLHLLAILVGVGIMIALVFFGPGHTH
jgi:zinc and cadmium transporter